MGDEMEEYLQPENTQTVFLTERLGVKLAIFFMRTGDKQKNGSLHYHAV